MNPFSYQGLPDFRDASLIKNLQNVTEQLQKEYVLQFDAWLKQCVKDFCPEAYEAVERGNFLSAGRILLDQGFHYRTVRGSDTTEFCQGETVLARARFEVEFTVKSESL